jgi:RES domain-containing protein
MIQAWRIVHEDFLHVAFEGEGAKIAGGRWNSEGVSMVYTAASLSLALLEIIVHLEIKETLNYFKAIPILFSEELIQAVKADSLPFAWNALPAGLATKGLGDRWIKTGSSAVLCVPSAVVPNECNYLLNPQHSDFQNISIGIPVDLPLDPRVFEKLK